MRRLIRVTALLLCLAALSSCAPGSTTPSVTVDSVKLLNFEVDAALGADVLAQVDMFADNVQRISKGKLAVDVNTGTPDAQSLSGGKSDFALLTNHQLVRADNLFSMFSLPFLYDDNIHMSLALNSRELLGPLAERLTEENLIPLMAAYRGSAVLVTSGKEIRLPSDFKELSIAMRADSADRLAVFESLGAKVFPYPRSLVAAQLGSEANLLAEEGKRPRKTVINAVEASLEEALEIQPTEGGLCLINTFHTSSPLWVVANSKSFNALSGYEQAVLREAFAGLLPGLENVQTAQDSALLKKAEAQDMILVEVERPRIASSVYDAGAEKYLPPEYFDHQLYEVLQSFSHAG